jgi:hypothetical protein
MQEILKIIKNAKKALDAMENGKTFTSAYVADRLEKAADLNTKDALICHMRDVFHKKASTQQFVTQKEIAKVYDDLYGMSGGRSNFREILGDLLPTKHASVEAVDRNASSARIPYENQLEPMYSENSFSKEFSDVFDLDRRASFGALSDNMVKRAEKYTKLQLSSLGCLPQEVRAVKTNEHFILCSASVDTSDATQVSVAVPVQLTNGIPSMPTHFIQGDELVKLNKENLYVFIKDKNNFRKKAAKDSFAGQRAAREFSIDTPFLPASLEKFAKLEDELVASATHFKPNQVKLATSIVAAELASLVTNPQVKVASSDAKTLTFNVSVPTGAGRVDLRVPVDMPHGQPVIPSSFEFEGSKYKLNEQNLRTVVSAASNSNNIQKISREVEEMSALSYHQLVDRMIAGVSDGDYKLAEDALNTIGTKFAGDQYIQALGKFGQLLKHASVDNDRNNLIKQAMQRGDLIRVPTSVELYCPKLGLPASKIDFDDIGRPIPARRKAQRDNLDESGAAISSYRITIS